MKGIDFQSNFGEYLLDEDRKISNEHLCNVCKKDTKEACRYIGLSVIGFVCAKNTPLKKMLDQKVKENKFSAIGDNCSGIGLKTD